MAFIILEVYQHLENIHLEGTMSQNLVIGPSLNYFLKIIFLDFVKWELGPISQI